MFWGTQTHLTEAPTSYGAWIISPHLPWLWASVDSSLHMLPSVSCRDTRRSTQWDSNASPNLYLPKSLYPLWGNCRGSHILWGAWWWLLPGEASFLLGTSSDTDQITPCTASSSQRARGAGKVPLLSFYPIISSQRPTCCTVHAVLETPHGLVDQVSSDVNLGWLFFFFKVFLLKEEEKSLFNSYPISAVHNMFLQNTRLVLCSLEAIFVHYTFQSIHHQLGQNYKKNSQLVGNYPHLYVVAMPMLNVAVSALSAMISTSTVFQSPGEMPWFHGSRKDIPELTRDHYVWAPNR